MVMTGKHVSTHRRSPKVTLGRSLRPVPLSRKVARRAVHVGFHGGRIRWGRFPPGEARRHCDALIPLCANRAAMSHLMVVASRRLQMGLRRVLCVTGDVLWWRQTAQVSLNSSRQTRGEQVERLTSHRENDRITNRWTDSGCGMWVVRGPQARGFRAEGPRARTPQPSLRETARPPSIEPTQAENPDSSSGIIIQS